MTSTAPHTFDIGIDRDELIRHHAKLEATLVRILGGVVMFYVAATGHGVIISDTDNL